jgi:hypothetical protein
MNQPTVRCGCGRQMTPDALRGADSYRCGCGARVMITLPDAKRCAGYREGARCRMAPVRGIPVDLCAEHAAELRQLWTAPPDAAAPIPVVCAPRFPVVYYIRFGDRIKIGTTTWLPTRLRELPHDALLGVERGGQDVERKRHQQFAALHVSGEWFRADDSLILHISTLTPVPECAADVHSEAPTGDDLMTAADLAASLGIKTRTIYEWRRRGFLVRRGLTAAGRELYSAAEVAQVAASPRRRNRVVAA